MSLSINQSINSVINQSVSQSINQSILSPAGPPFESCPVYNLSFSSLSTVPLQWVLLTCAVLDVSYSYQWCPHSTNPRLSLPGPWEALTHTQSMSGSTSRNVMLPVGWLQFSTRSMCTVIVVPVSFSLRED